MFRTMEEVYESPTLKEGIRLVDYWAGRSALELWRRQQSLLMPYVLVFARLGEGEEVAVNMPRALFVELRVRSLSEGDLNEAAAAGRQSFDNTVGKLDPPLDLQLGETRVLASRQRITLPPISARSRASRMKVETTRLPALMPGPW